MDSFNQSSNARLTCCASKQKQLTKITVCAMLAALGVVLSRIASIPLFALPGVSSMYIGFGPLPILLVCCLYGPLYGGITAMVWDVVGALLFPTGAFNPAFSVSAFIFGLVCGAMFLRRKTDLPGYGRTIAAVAVAQTVFSVVLNTALIVFFYSAPWQPLLLARLIEAAVMIPLNSFLIVMLLKLLSKAGFIERS